MLDTRRSRVRAADVFRNNEELTYRFRPIRQSHPPLEWVVLSSGPASGEGTQTGQLLAGIARQRLQGIS
eukprot:2467270-Rhodomonas_salina.2